jgi:hypothetical protein
MASQSLSPVVKDAPPDWIVGTYNASTSIDQIESDLARMHRDHCRKDDYRVRKTLKPA